MASGALLASCGNSTTPAASSAPAASDPASTPKSVEPASDPASTPKSVDPAGDSEDSEPASESESMGDSSESDPTFTLYLKVADWWYGDEARSGIYLWNSDETNAAWPGEAMESVGTGMWKFTIEDPTLYTNLIFTRISPADPVADWGAKTIDLSIADIDLATPLYDISGQETPIWGDPGVSGNWVAYNAD